MKKVSLILPTYNEAGNIIKLIPAITSQTKLKSYQLEFVVVDDDSPDATATQVRNLIKKGLPIKLLVRKNQRGLATAIKLGLQKSRGEVVVLMDTDFNHRPEDIPRLIRPLEADQADLVIGSRYIKGGGMHLTEANQLQFWLSKIGNFFVNRLLLGLPVYESLSGFIACKRSLFDRLDLDKIFTGYGDYCIRLLHQVHQAHFKIKEVPVIYGQRRYGQSKSRLLKMFFSYFKTSLQLKFFSSRQRA